MKNPFIVRRDFSSLSVLDLLEAREHYHVYLANLENVVATAIGRYRIRKEDPDSTRPQRGRDRRNAPPRTLQNTWVQTWSWPCLLIFVDKWKTEEELRAEPDQVVPRFLYMPDGRVVPTCVILAMREDKAPPPLDGLTFPSDLIGGGYPVLTDVQEQEHVGSLGCLVTDGDSIYALTNRHVIGEAGRHVFTVVRGERQRIGVSHALQTGKLAFSKAFLDWPGKQVMVNIDAGLIRVDDSNRWTAQVFGIGELDTPIDLNTNTLSLDLIGTNVKAFGGASGQLVGQIHGLFYRYQSIGGFDYVADLLIGPRDERSPVKTKPGDSGTLWCFDPEGKPQSGLEVARVPGTRAPRFKPIAVQWGGHRLLTAQGEEGLQFALATFVSTICRVLEVEIVRDWNIGHSEYWGRLGHYKIGAAACGLVSSEKARKLFEANLERIAFGDDAIEQGALKRIDSTQFVPLADVPDFVWRKTRKKDDANHFADMDEEGAAEFGGKTLLALCEDPGQVDAKVWNGFYDSLNVGAKRGALPFRVWQIYDDMVGFLKGGRLAEFVCAAGILAHYVGDACQPLHVSHLHHGENPDDPVESQVHSVYEDRMPDRRAAELVEGINRALARRRARADVTGGHAAAVSVVRLMGHTIERLPPADVLEAFAAASGRERVPHMWDVLGDRTIVCMAEGTVRLASLWTSAWTEGNGDRLGANRLRAIEREELMELYNDAAFLPALRLREMEETGRFSPSAIGRRDGQPGVRRRSSGRKKR